MIVRMTPSLDEMEGEEGGIATVIRKYYQHLPDAGIELMDRDYDLVAVHAASAGDVLPLKFPLVSHLHGVYFTDEYAVNPDGWETNRRIAKWARGADAVTVPSEWVAEVFRR